MTDITNENFEENFDRIVGDIDCAKFIAIDLEMTGIHVPSSAGSAAFPVTMDYIGDTPHRRYQKGKYSAHDYSIIQFGLALFTPTKIPPPPTSDQTQSAVALGSGKS